MNDGNEKNPMSNNNLLWTSVGRKLITGITGLAMVAFLIVHLIGNFTLFGGPDTFNAYAHFLENLAHGWFVKLADAGLLAFVFLHMVAAIRVRASKSKARKSAYIVESHAGGASKKTASSMGMLISGCALFLFIILHIMHFKYGNTEKITVHGEEMRDLYSLVIHEFKQIPQVMLYVAFMLGLGMHLKHGIWSALQSLGATRPHLAQALYKVSGLLGIFMALGFLLLPVAIYFFFELP